MREYASKPQNISHTPDDIPKASRQPPISEILQSYRNGSPAENTIQNKPVEIENWRQTESTANTKTNGTNVIQQKIYLNNDQYNYKEGDDVKIVTACADNFIRRYDNEDEMRSHFAGDPSKYGLIKNIALWYKIPYLAGVGKKFFVLGESHAGVRGTDIARQSNIQPNKIFYEAHSDSWSVAEKDKRYDPGSKSPDEISSKLLRALEYTFSKLLVEKNPPPSPSPVLGDEIPKIPEGQKSTRKEKDGTYRLVIKGEDGKEKFWTPDAGDTNIVPNNYNIGDEALFAIKEMAPKVLTADFLKELEKSDADTSSKASRALNYLNNGTYENPTISGFPSDKKLNVKISIISFIMNAVKIVLADHNKNYLKLLPGVSADYYRDGFMLDAINNVPEGRFDFAAIGDAHLRNIKSALKGDIPSISMDEFYTSPYSENAVDIPD